MTEAVDHSHRVHEFLLSPSAYPELPAIVELRETHISWVYLTERYVYKQKKPVRFEFLNSSTLDRRKHYCEQEVMLNKRWSPDIYLGTIPVSLDAAGRYLLKRGNHVVEWLVKMKRLDDSQTLERLIQDDQLTQAHIQRLSNRLTEFYVGQAPTMVRSSEFLQRLQQHVLANGHDLLIGPADRDVVLFATNSQLRCLALESDYFIQRVADGRVVDGHGDLRPEHVYFHQTKPMIIDCIEFNAEYRNNDVVDELAFLSMECDRLGNDDVGQALLAAYLRAGHDNLRPFLFAFYKCYRACVRAKVASIRAAQAVEDQKVEALTRCEDYVRLARRYAKELGTKVVIVVGGLSGTGKSTLAAALQEPLAAELLQTDAIRNAPCRGNQATNGRYTWESRRRVYMAMIDRMADSLARSPTLILDGTFASREIRRAALDRAERLGAKVLRVQCECPASTAQARIAQRIASGDRISEATPELHAAQAIQYEAVTDGMPAVVVDTTEPGPLQVKLVIDAVRKLAG